MEHFDVVIVGTGAAATSVAYPCRAAGKSVALIDDRPFGGTCVNRGCDPKKVLVGVADTVDRARRMTGYGASGDVCIDWPALMRFKRTFTDPVPLSREKSFRDEGMEAIHGVARFRDAETLEVNGRLLAATHFVLAAGASPAPLGIPGEELLATSDDFLELGSLPEKIVFIGGGYIAFEFAHLARRAGAEVTILHRGKRALEHFDADLVSQLVDWTRECGIEVHLETPVDRITEGVVHSGDRSFPASLAVHAAGRVPPLERLNIAAAGIAGDRRGVAVNEYLQSPTNPRAYAAGDYSASGGPALTPVAGYEGRVVAANILEGNHVKTDYRAIPSVVFTLPPLASLGMTEEQARKQGIDYGCNAANTAGWYSSRRLNEKSSGYKVLVDKSSKKLLGAHIFGDGSEELINVFALALRSGLTVDEIRSVLYAYPTHGSNIQYML